MVASRFVLQRAAIFGFLAALPILLLAYVPLDGHIDVSRHPLGRDFVNLWVAGRLLLEGAWQTLFDHSAYQDALHRLFDPRITRHAWSYPPTSFLWAAPLGALPYGLALGVWSISGLIAFFAAARIGLKPEDAKRTAVVLALAPATFLNLICGQNGFFTAALMAGGILLLDRRPLLAGVLIGLLSYKPHIGLVVAVALVALGAWRTIIAATLTAVAMALVSMVLFGDEPWIAFLQQTMPYQEQTLRTFQGFFTAMLVSPYAALRTVGQSHTAALAIQAIISVAAIIACAIAVRRTDNADARLSVIVAATFLVTPYALIYDLPVLALAIARQFARAPKASWTSEEVAAYGGVWAMPLASMSLSFIGAPLTPLFIGAFFMLKIKSLLVHSALPPLALAAPAGRAPASSRL